MSLKRTCIELQENVNDIKKQNITQTEEINHVKRFSMRNNIRIVGVPTRAKEDIMGVDMKFYKRMLPVKDRTGMDKYVGRDRHKC